VEVGPAFVVDGDDGAGADQLARLDGLPGVHAVAHRPGDREAHASQVEQGGVDLEAVGDLADAVIQHRVAGDPQDPVRLALPAQGEADHVPGRWGDSAAGRAGKGWRDLDRRASRGLQSGGRPWLEAAGVAAQPPAAGGGGEDDTGRWEQGPAGGIQVVAVVVVAEQDGVDRAEVGGGDRRAGQLAGARAPAEAVPAPRGGKVGSVSSRQPSTSSRPSGRRCG
jgi:hypothetical protein